MGKIQNAIDKNSELNSFLFKIRYDAIYDIKLEDEKRYILRIYTIVSHSQYSLAYMVVE